MACGIGLDQGWRPCLLHGLADSLPLSHQGCLQGADLNFDWQIGPRGPLRFITAGCLEHIGKLGGWILTWNTCSVIDYWCLPWAQIYVCVCVCVCLPLPTVYIWESRSLRSQSVVLVPWQRQSERNPISCERRGGPWVHRFCEFRVILVKFLAFPQQSKCGALQLWWRSWQAAWSTLPLAHQMAENLSWQRLGFKNGSWPRAFKMGWGELFALVPLGASASPHNGVMGTTWSRKQNCWSCDQS